MANGAELIAAERERRDPWPWSNSSDKRKNQSNYPNAFPVDHEGRVRMLVRAGALIAAEVDRLLRRTEQGDDDDA